jgi:predicted transcriptional regulator
MKDLSALRFIESFKKVKLFTVEGKIVVFLIEHGAAGQKDIAVGLNHSQSSISSKLKILCAAGILMKSVEAAKASVKYEVTPHILDIVRDFDFA